MSRNTIIQFLQDFEDCIFLEHVYLIKKFLKQIDEREKNGDCPCYSRYGCHFQSCSWSRDEAFVGPEYCGCSFFEKRQKFIADLIKKYYLLSKYFYIT